MHIDLVMISRLGPADGGRETWLKNFLKEIAKLKLGYKFSLKTLKKEKNNILSSIDQSVLANAIEIKCEKSWIPIAINFIIKFFIKNVFRKKNADHVIAVGGLEEALAVAISYLVRPVNGQKILWLRTIYTKEKGYRLNKITQFLLLKFEIYLIRYFFDLVIVNGEDTAEFYRAKGINCVVINNAIETEKWSKISISPSTKIRIAFIGRLSEVKGIKSFLNSIELLYENYGLNGFEFHIAGDGPFKEAVLELQNRKLLTYHGAIPNDAVPLLLAQMDCCVALTFLMDFMGGGGVSNALIEQMASGQKIIAWNNKIFKKVLTEENSYLVDQGSTEQIVNSYLSIYSNQDLAKSKAAAAKITSKNYSIVNHVQIFIELIKTLPIVSR